VFIWHDIRIAWAYINLLYNYIVGYILITFRVINRFK